MSIHNRNMSQLQYRDILKPFDSTKEIYCTYKMLSLIIVSA